MSRPDLIQRLAAILAADVVGYSRLMATDERGTIEALDAARAVFKARIEARRGRVVDMAGDSVLAVFETAIGAVTAALEIQAQIKAAADATLEDRRMRFRIGVHLGDVTEKPDGTVYGDGVNIAARLEGLAEPGGIMVSDSIRSAVKGKVAADFEDLGEQQVKNIDGPVRAYGVKAVGNLWLSVAGVHVAQPVAGFSGRPAIAVLPFANLSGDPREEYFGDGLAEDILTRLAMWRWLPVIARNSAFAYRGQAADAKAVGLALGARYVFDGSVRKTGDRVRVNGQLVDAMTGHHLWAERYDRVLEDLFAIQDELTDGIVGALEAVIGRAEVQRAHVKAPADLDAWDYFLRGRWHFNRMSRDDFAAAIPLFLSAARLDPGLAAPHSGIASLRLCELVFLWTDTPRETVREAMMSAHAALAIDPLDASAHSTLGYLLALAGKHDEALAFCTKCIELNPSYASGYLALCITHALRGEAQAGIKAVENAIRISPNDLLLPNFLASLSFVHYLAHNYEKAAEVASLAVQRKPDYAGGWRTLANALGQLGRLPEAREALERCITLMPSFTTEPVARASMGFRDEAVFQHWLEGLRKAGWRG